MKLPLMAGLLLATLGALPAAEPVSPEVAALILQAGNANAEEERAQLLDKLAATPGVPAPLAAEAKALAEFAHKWTTGGLAFYHTRMKGQGPKAGATFDMGVAPDSPLLPLSALYRGRILAWDLIESSTIRSSEPMKHWCKDTATAFFQQAADAFPKNEVAKMYLGTPVPWGHAYEPAPGAPEWAVLQRESLDRLRDIILWWIEKRQDKSGQYGGGRGDDCEMWRWWAPLLLGFEEPKIRAAQLKMSKNTLRSADLQKFGYNNEITDVEHSAEDTADSLIPLLLEPDEPKWTEGARHLARLMRDVWTGKNERGQIQFKSFYFSATEVAPQPARALDVMADVGAINPALVVWQRTGDPEIGAIVTPWLATWVDATARAENGKPAGVLPAAIHWPDGAATGALDHWWEPVKPGGYMYTYYLWPSISTELTNALALAATMTGDQKFLDPLRSMGRQRLAAIRQPAAAAPEPGSAAWCATLLVPRPNSNSSGTGLVKSLARARALTGTREFDELIAAESGEFAIRDDATGRRDLEAALRASLATLRVNFAGFTSEVRATDRVLRFVQFLAQGYDFDGYQGVTLPKHELLYRMITGDQDAPRTPNPAVHWRTPFSDLAVLVTENLPGHFAAELYHFGPAPRPMSAEFPALSAGDYNVQLTAGDQPLGEATKMTVVKGKAGVVKFELPSRKLCVLKVTGQRK